MAALISFGWGDYTSVTSSGTSGWRGSSSPYLIDDGINIGYIAVPQRLDINVASEFVEVSSMETVKKVKRVSLFGKLVENGDEEKQSILALKWIKDAKKKLSKKEQNEYIKLAETAFQEAVKNMENGMKDVSRQFEKEMNKALLQVTPAHFGYDTFITNREVNLFRDHLPKNKELIIDEIDEYEKPLPRDIEKKLKDARQAGCFEKFVIFWVRTIKDPIIFGLVKGDSNKFYFIAEWDDDVSVQDFLKYKN